MIRSTPAPGGLRALFAGGTATGSTDDQLLQRFRSRSGAGDPAAEAAFAALVDRHAAMVWGVCRRGLLDRADAEDAFQATFLVLVRKASSVRVDDRGSIGRWLYGVARKVAARQRRAAARRPTVVVEPATGDDPAIAAQRREACAAVSAELDRLPAKYRRPIELCDYEGLTYEQAALSLGWPTATIKSRLARGRQRLKGRLARRGLAPLAGAVAAELARECRAGVSQAVLSSTSRVATIASGLVPAAVARLAEGATQAMMWNKLKPLAILVLCGVGTSSLAVAWTLPRQADKPPPPVTGSAPGQERTADKPDTRWARQLPNGMRLEIMAVSPIPDSPKTWWRPDGRSMKSPDFQPNFLTSVTESAVVSDRSTRLAIVYRVAGRPDGGQVLALIDGADTIGYKNLPTSDEDPSTTSHAILATFPRSTTSLTVRFRVSCDAWETVKTLDTQASSTGGGKGRSLISSGAIADGGGGSTLCLAHDVGGSESLRVLAVDASGKEQSPSRVGSSSAGGFQQLIAKFALPPEAIREFRVQTRPCDEILMPDVATSPIGPAPR
ncbi:RNA polymerase sigma factor [Paludisphaera soli]|uniref:RNA polymerase sigma factor n=1 Tax=Paludisphaera soli TaxID=2712865 RepID=UPI0013EC138E|nr:sigma-70 family RNA polymerase sigma factor [Paludisphaera soli]